MLFFVSQYGGEEDMRINEEGKKRENRWTFSNSCFGNV